MNSKKYLNLANKFKKIHTKEKLRPQKDQSSDLEVFKDFIEHHLKFSNVLPK